MVYNPAVHHRRSIRLKGYDYSQSGAYFVTAIAQARENLFGASIVKKTADYHQFHAANKVVEQTLRAPNMKGNRRVGVVWTGCPTRYADVRA